jgi:hypothetical protein
VFRGEVDDISARAFTTVKLEGFDHFNKGQWPDTTQFIDAQMPDTRLALAGQSE